MSRQRIADLLNYRTETQYVILHPTIRIACFFLLVAGLAMTKHAMILILPIFFILFMIHCRFMAVIPVLKRLRWLLLSLFILHLWFNSVEFRWLPTSIDLLLALERVGALMIMVFAAHLLMQVTPPQEMISALRWWLVPFERIGFPSEKLAIRLTLVLETVYTVQNFYDQQTTPPTAESSPLPRPSWFNLPQMKGYIQYSINRISVMAADLFIRIFKYAENSPLRMIEIPELTAPPLWQWSYPLLLFMLIILS